MSVRVFVRVQVVRGVDFSWGAFATKTYILLSCCNYLYLILFLPIYVFPLFSFSHPSLVLILVVLSFLALFLQ